MVSSGEKEVLLQAVFDDMFEKRAMFGTVERCVEFARRLQKVGTDEIACFVDFGLNFDQVLAALPKLDQVKAAFENTNATKAQPTEKAKHPLAWYYHRESLGI